MDLEIDLKMDKKYTKKDVKIKPKNGSKIELK